MLQYDEADLADFGGYDLVHHDDLSYVASAHQECKGVFKIVHTTLLHSPLEFFLSFLEATIGMGRPRKTHLENILPRGSRDRDPRYPRGSHGTKIFF